MSSSKNFWIEVQNAILNILFEEPMDISEITEILEDEYREKFETGYIDAAGVVRMIEDLQEEEHIFFDNRTDKYCRIS